MGSGSSSFVSMHFARLLSHCPQKPLTRCILLLRHLLAKPTDAPWCGHCKKMAPVYEKVAEHYHRAPNPRVHVGKIDGTAHPGLAAPFDLKGYPTVLLLRDGEMISEFNGPRTLDGIKAFVDGAINEPSAAGAPAAPRIGGGGGGRASGATGESLSTRLTRMAKSLSETDPITAALSMLGIAVSAALGLVILLCATTSAPPERGAAGAR